MITAWIILFLVFWVGYTLYILPDVNCYIISILLGLLASFVAVSFTVGTPFLLAYSINIWY